MKSCLWSLGDGGVEAETAQLECCFLETTVDQPPLLEEVEVTSGFRPRFAHSRFLCVVHDACLGVLASSEPDRECSQPGSSAARTSAAVGGNGKAPAYRGQTSPETRRREVGSGVGLTTAVAPPFLRLAGSGGKWRISGRHLEPRAMRFDSFESSIVGPETAVERQKDNDFFLSEDHLDVLLDAEPVEKLACKDSSFRQ